MCSDNTLPRIISSYCHGETIITHVKVHFILVYLVDTWRVSNKSCSSAEVAEEDFSEEEGFGREVDDACKAQGHRGYQQHGCHYNKNEYKLNIIWFNFNRRDRCEG